MMIHPHDHRLNLEELKTPSRAHSPPRSFDTLEIILPLGRGGYSQVYLVQCRESKVEYVLKCLNEESGLSSEEDREKKKTIEQSWIDEFNIGHRISSLSNTRFLLPTIAKFKNTQNQLCLLFPYSGPLVPLYKCLPSASLKEDQIRLYMAQLICATTTLHSELGILHGDIKSGNIMVSAKGQLVLMDFGLSQEIESCSGCRPIHTTVYIESPEGLRRTIASSTTANGFSRDWWSLGIVMYEMIQGRPPWSYQITRSELGNILNSPESLERALDWTALEKVCSGHGLSVLAQLLAYDSGNRSGGRDSIQSHVWFHSIDWKVLQDTGIPSTYVPNVMALSQNLMPRADSNTSSYDSSSDGHPSIEFDF